MNRDKSERKDVGKLRGEDLAHCNTKDNLKIIIHGKAYDLTEFAPEHPGGSAILYKYGGKDATEAYEPIHPPGKHRLLLLTRSYTDSSRHA